MNKIEPKNVYTLSTISRSFDKYHVDNNRIHLVSSNFYTTKFNIDSNTRFITKKFVKRVFGTSNDNLDFEIIEHTPNCVEFIFPIVYLFQKFYNSEIENPNIDTFLKILLGDYYLQSRNPEGEVNTDLLLSKLLFVYGQVSYNTLQILHSRFKIDISGGTISNRHMLSTVAYNLTTILIQLGYTLEDVYESSSLIPNKLRDTEEFNVSTLDSFLNSGLKSTRITITINSTIQKYKQEIDYLNNEIQLSLCLKGCRPEGEGNITSLDLELQLRLEEKASAKKSFTTTRISILNRNIAKGRERVESIKKEILNLESKISDLNTELTELPSLSPSEIQDKFRNLVSAVNMESDKKKLKSYFTRKPKRVNNFSFWPAACKAKAGHSNHNPNRGGWREYSTFATTSNLIVNSLISSNKTCSSVYCLITPITRMEKREIYTGFNNSQVSENIRNLIYSEDSKENIQLLRRIEKFLISEQNNLLLNQFSNTDTDINYKLFDPIIIKVL